MVAGEDSKVKGNICSIWETYKFWKVECKKQKKWEKSEDVEREGNDGGKTPFKVDLRPNKAEVLKLGCIMESLGSLKNNKLI